MAALTIATFKAMSDGDRKKINKDTLVKLILESEAPQMDELTSAIKCLSELVESYKKETQQNSEEIVKMKVEMELIRDENRQLKKNYRRE